LAEIVAVRGDEADPAAVARAAAALASGGLLIYPTDTLYALGGRAADAGAGAAVRAAKGRDDAKPLPVVAADEAQARALCAAWPESARRAAERFWPGPLTLVLKAAVVLSDAVTAGTGTVAVRVPALALTRALCAAAGPLVATSANRSGEPAPTTCAEAVRQVGPAALLALDAGPGRPVASTIVDLSVPEPRLLRAGAVPWEDVHRVLAAGRG
jgi:L-threonylcarbamoyladenylate synthase